MKGFLLIAMFSIPPLSAQEQQSKIFEALGSAVKSGGLGPEFSGFSLRSSEETEEVRADYSGPSGEMEIPPAQVGSPWLKGSAPQIGLPADASGFGTVPWYSKGSPDMGEKIGDADLRRLREAIDLLGNTRNGSAAYFTYHSAKVEIRWKQGEFLAWTPPPSEVGGRNIIWLNKTVQAYLTSQGFTAGVKSGLAIALAHELTHEDTFLKINKCYTQYCGYMLEAGGFLNGMAVYHELRSKGIVPSANSVAETEFLQEQRMYLDIWDYKHGGPRPDMKSYGKLLKLKDSSDPALLEVYKNAVKILDSLKAKANGVMALSEIIRVKYGYKPVPGFLATLTVPVDELQRYYDLFWEVYDADKVYCDWRTRIGHPVLQPSPVYSPATYNPINQQHIPQSPSPQPSQGSPAGPGGAGGSGPIDQSGTSTIPSGNTQPFTPNPHFQPNTWQTAGH